MIFVTVGTTKFSFNRLLQAIDKAMLDSNKHESLIIQSGTSAYQFKYRNTQVFKEMPFDKMISFFKKSRLTICHGGPATIFLALKFGKNKPLAVPRTRKFGEHVDDHEVSFARYLKEGKKVEIVLPKENLSLKLKEYLNYQKVSKKRKNLAPPKRLIEKLVSFTKKSQAPIFIIFFQLGIGGVERRIVDITNYLGNLKPELPIYILLRKKTEFDISNQVKNKKAKIINYLDWARIKVPFFFPVFILYHVWRLRPRSVLAFLDYSSLPAVWSKMVLFWRKIIIVLNEAHFASKIIANYDYPGIRRFLVRVFYPLADVIISPTEVTKKDLVKNFDLSGNKIRVIPNWTGFTKKKPLDSTKKYDLILIGRLAKTKNIRLLLKAIKRLREIKKDIGLAIVGAGEEEEMLKNIAIKYKIINNVEFLGARYDVENLLHKARIFIYSSRYQAEGFPLAILEAMAIGVPVLCRRFAGVEEVIRDGENGFIFSSLEELIEKIPWLLNNPARRKEVARQARVYVGKYHSMENIKKYLDALGIEPN